MIGYFKKSLPTWQFAQETHNYVETNSTLPPVSCGLELRLLSCMSAEAGGTAVWFLFSDQWRSSSDVLNILTWTHWCCVKQQKMDTVTLDHRSIWSESCFQSSLPSAAKPFFPLPAALCIQMRQSRHGICLFLFKILFYIWVLLNKLPQNWLDLLTHLTLHDCESLLSFWNQDCWACRHSALVITPSLSRLRPRNTDRAVSLSLAVNSRTSEFWGK